MFGTSYLTRERDGEEISGTEGGPTAAPAGSARRQRGTAAAMPEVGAVS